MTGGNRHCTVLLCCASVISKNYLDTILSICRKISLLSRNNFTQSKLFKYYRVKLCIIEDIENLRPRSLRLVITTSRTWRTVSRFTCHQLPSVAPSVRAQLPCPASGFTFPSTAFEDACFRSGVLDWLVGFPRARLCFRSTSVCVQSLSSTEKRQVSNDRKCCGPFINHDNLNMLIQK